MNYHLRLKVLIAIFVFAFTQQCFAITASELPIPTQVPDLEEQIDGTVEPQYPHPGDTVTITLEAYGTDIDRSEISWTADGKEISRSRGQKSIKVVAGKLGSTMVVVARIDPVNGPTVTKTFYVNPQTVDIIWESDSYTPPFYKGKSMYSPQEKVKFVAMPNIVNAQGVLAGPGEVAYKWKKDNEVQGDYSGYGVRSFSYKGTILMQPVMIGMEASIDGGNTASNYINLAPRYPEVAFYENSPLYGFLWNKELSAGFEFGNANEKTVAAFPYFFGVTRKNDSDLTYDWSINGQGVYVAPNQTDMTFRNSENLEGISQIGITVQSTSNFLEEAEGAMQINFKKQGKASLL